MKCLAGIVGLIGLNLVASGCAHSQHDDTASNIEELFAKHVELDGKSVRATGYLTICKRTYCEIAARKNRKDRANSRLSIGSSDWFDRRVRNLVGRKIIVEGVLNAECMHSAADKTYPHGEVENPVICLDRANQLKSPKLIRVY